jgi:atypical dual specificity phosphatase
LPSHFRWILPGRLAGMGRPGLLGPADQDLEAVASAGATLLVTLTEEPLPFDLRPYGLLGRHFPIRDMGVPSIHATAALCREIERGFATGGVVLHCHAGLGRTGTVLAAALCWLGHPPDEAIATLRGIGRSYIQTRSQEEFVRSFAAAVGTGARG